MIVPKLKKKIFDKFMLWFEKSNQYMITDPFVDGLIEHYLDSKSKKDFVFKASLSFDLDENLLSNIHTELEANFKSLDLDSDNEEVQKLSLDKDQRKIECAYRIGQTVVKVFYSDEKVKELIHPQIAHTRIDVTDLNNPFIFDISFIGHHFYLYENETFVKAFTANNPHLLQGKFAMRLLCAIHHNSESEWIASLHASTVAFHDDAILIVGKSGQGKSTFTAHLMAAGYQLVADDLTPLKSNTQQVYPYPSGISIKKGAFGSLKHKISNFEELPEVFKSHEKGHIKYIPSINEIDNYQKGFNSKIVLLINYEPSATTQLETISFEKALNVIIVDSWISPLEENAKQFMDWVGTLKYFELTYSNTDEAIDLFNQLLKSNI